MKPGNLVKPNKIGLERMPPGVRDRVRGAVGLALKEYPLAYKLVDGEKEYPYLVHFEELQDNHTLRHSNLFFNNEVEVIS